MNGTLLQILNIVAPILAAGLTGGGIVAYFKYRESRPKTEAEAKQINVSAEISVAEAWQRYAEKVEVRFSELEKKYDTAIALKDQEIHRLQADVNRLETELKKYRIIDVNKEVARETIHSAVDENIDHIKPE